jgi:hypothetical protein
MPALLVLQEHLLLVSSNLPEHFHAGQKKVPDDHQGAPVRKQPQSQPA